MNDLPKLSRLAAARHESVENEAILIDGSPQPVLFACDDDRNFVELPCVVELRRTSTNTAGEVPPEYLSSVSDGLVADDDSSRREHVLDHAKADGEAKIQPYGLTDHLGANAVTVVQTIARRFHTDRLSPDGESPVNLAVPLPPFETQLRSGLRRLARNGPCRDSGVNSSVRMSDRTMAE